MQKSPHTTVLILKIQKTLNTMDLRERVADWVFSRWHTGFMIKSAGEADEFGNKWEKLSNARLNQKAARTRGGFRAVDRGELWRQRNRQLVGQLTRAGMPLAQARAKANALQWQNVNIPINIDTTRLERSLRPEGSSEQIRDVGERQIVLGTEVTRKGKPYAHHVNNQRRFLPTGREAAVWLKDLLVDVRERIIREAA